MAGSQEAKAESSCHVSYRRYTRSEIKFYYYPTSRALGGGLMYQDDGTPTYCIWWAGKTVKNNTLTVSDLEDVVTSEECLKGLYIIMQNGYDGGTNYTVGGINLGSYGSDADEKEELAYYSTSWAIHLWMARYGYEQTALVQNTADAMTWTASSLRAYGTNGKVSNSTMGAGSSDLSKAAWKASMELLALAVEGEDKTATADVTLKSQTIEGNYNVITLDITTTNATGWTLTYSTLPSGSSVSKTSGTTSSDTVTVKIPISSTSSTYTFTATPDGIGRYVTDSYQYITGTNELQSLLTWDADFTGKGESGRVSVSTTTAPTASLSLTKVDSSTGDKLAGATFTIQEQVTVDGTATWFDVGTLTDTDGNGTYSNISLTKYYDTDGNAHSYSTAKTSLVRTRYNSGNFRVKETTAPTGYTALGTSWYWYVQVVSSGSWSSLSPAGGVLGGSTSGTYVVGKKSETGYVWHFIKSGSTAKYSDYATYNTSSSSNYDYGTSLGNTPESAKLSLTKVDSITGTAVAGATFTIYERVNGTWYAVGTLTDDDGNGTYSNISITCHYNSSGKKKTLATAQTKLVYTSANSGDYRIKETAAPAGYEVQSSWEWLVRVIPSASWTGTMYSLYGTNSDGTEMVGYRSSGSAFWSYVKGSSGGSNTATYALNAKYSPTMTAYNYSSSKLAETGESGKLSLNKVDDSTGEALTGAVFTIYERVGGTWYAVGTLTDDDGNGTYSNISVTMHYTSSGSTVSVSETKLVYTSANTGEYRIKETTPPDGYKENTSWEWLVRVIPSADWSSASMYNQLDAGTYSSEMIGYPKSSSTGVWTYLKSGNTAYYSHYAPYAKNASSYNYGTKLGNTADGIDVTLTKVDYITGTKLTGAVFSIEEKVNGSWYEVGTLTESASTSGTYNVISVTKHYSTNGKEIKLVKTQTQLVCTEANGGEYRIREITPPDNYEASEDWCWYITVVSESEWPSGTDTTGLEGTLLSGNYAASSAGSTWKIMKVSDTKAVHYVEQGGTASYAWYAMYDVNAENKAATYNRTSLGNLGISIGLSLNKIDYNSEEPLSGITFEIQEYVNENWYTVGTLGESEDTKGTYDVISITKHYYTTSSGSVTYKTLTEAEDVLRYTSANGGLYRVVETAVPTGYVLAEDWAWYVHVSSEKTLENASNAGAVLGEGTDYKVVGEETDSYADLENIFAVVSPSVSPTYYTLTFYSGDDVPSVGETYDGLEVIAVYTGLESTDYQSASDVPWNYSSAGLLINSIEVAETICPTNMAYWFSEIHYSYSVDLSKIDTSLVTSMRGLFYNSQTLLHKTGLDTWDTSNVTDMSYMFFNNMSILGANGCYSYSDGTHTSTYVEDMSALGWDTSNVTDMSYMFFGCLHYYSGIDVSDWDTSGVTDMKFMFAASSITDACYYILGLETWDTSQVTNMSGMFLDQTYLYWLDLSSWNTANVTSMASMFEGCSSLETIYASELWSTESIVYNPGNMSVFLGCTSLVGGNGTAYVYSNGNLTTVAYTYAVIDTDSTPGYLTYKAFDGSQSEKVYAVAVHYVLDGSTAYYSDYAECDVTKKNISYNYELSDGSWVLANALTEVGLVLYKYGDDDTKLAGAEFTIQEMVGNTWYDIGTLTSGGNYVYDKVTITCHYDENGEMIELVNAQAGLVLLSANSGKYRVIETKAPGGYYCPTPDEWNWDLTVNTTLLTNGSASTTATNEELEKAAVTVRKVWDDADDYEGLRPTSIKVQLCRNGKAYGSTVTLSESNEWSYSWTDLSTSYTWSVEEVSVPSGYTCTTEYAENGLQKSYVLTNTHTPTTTKVTAVKTWEDDDDTAELRPTSIKVALYADSVKQGDSVTLSASTGWTYTWTDLYYYKKGSTSEKITYTVVEEEVAGYVQTKTSTTDSDGNLTITMTNTITKIPFLKVDTSGNAVAGATLRIVDSKENTVEEWTTDGTAHVVYGLEPGTYTLTETSAPDGYLRSASVSFTVGSDGKLAGGSTTITMTDENTSVNLLKIDAETGQPLAGAKLSVTSAETGDEILSWVSGDSSTKASSVSISSSYPNVTVVAQADGSILVTCLPAGEYILTETEAPDGYKVAGEVTFTVAETSTTQSITIEDERYRELRILKTDADGNAVSGATLGLYQGSLTELTEEDEDALVEVWVTDGTAHVLEDIAVGTYTLFELNTPDGYVTADPVTVTITQESKTVTAVMKDEPIVVSLLKTDKTTGTALAGATLTVTDVEGNTVVSFVSGSGSVKASSITVGDNYKDQITVSAQSDGSLAVTKLPAGDYTLMETKTPDGYVTAEAVSFSVEETTVTQSVTMEDDHIKVQISKTDLTDGTDVANAVLTVTDESGKTVLTWITGEVINGTASITSVTVGNDYKDQITASAVVNEDGNWAVETDYLPAGTYTLTETSVPDGYVKAESVKFTVEETGDIQTVEMQDDVTKLALYKIEKGTLASETDDDGNTVYSYTAVAGATLALKDSAGNLIVRFTSGDTVTKAVVLETGSVYKDLVYTEVTADGGVVLYRLPAGTSCTLTEEATPDGYITSADVTFTTTETEQMVYIFKENDYTKVAVWKVDAETGEELPGALLQILDESGNVVAEWYSGSEEFVLDSDGNEILVDSEGNVMTGLTQVTNADGTVTVYDAGGNLVTDVTRLTEYVASGEAHEIDRLAAGTYTLHEVSAPEDYNLSEDIRFRIAADGTVTSLTEGVSVTLTDGVYTITMEDQPGVPVYFGKVDENGTPLAGAVLAFYEGDVTEALLNGDEDVLEAALIERWTTDGTDHLIEQVMSGTYTLVEESAPDGYALAEAMVLTVDSSAQDSYHFTVINTPVMDMPSTGGSGMVPVVAFVGILICAFGIKKLLMCCL